MLMLWVSILILGCTVHCNPDIHPSHQKTFSEYKDPVWAQMYSASSEQHSLAMIVAFLLLLGVFASCADSGPPRKRALVEGDIAVTEKSVGSGTAMNAFLTAQNSLWPRGVVPYRIDTDEWNGIIEPVFTDSQITNITQALFKIENGVPCIEFR